MGKPTTVKPLHIKMTVRFVDLFGTGKHLDVSIDGDVKPYSRTGHIGCNTFYIYEPLSRLAGKAYVSRDWEGENFRFTIPMG